MQAVRALSLLLWCTLASSSCSLLLDPGSECATKECSHAAAKPVAGSAAPAEPACAMSCGGETPLCDAARGVCVQCVTNDQCVARELPPLCDATSHRCVECVMSSDCDEALPLCDTDANTCVECLANTDCQGRGVCDDTHHCVACNSDQDCRDPNMAHCDPDTHGCVGCDDDRQCSHLANRTVCDMADSRCVQCNRDHETTCNGNVCNLNMRTCTERRVATKQLCERCEWDSDCPGGNRPSAQRESRCVSLGFRNERATYCLLAAVENKPCERPFVRPIDRQVSASHADAARYCTIDELTTTCEAFLDAQHDRACTQDDAAACGRLTADDASCRPMSDEHLACTFPCTADDECPAGMSCGAMSYCLR